MNVLITGGAGYIGSHTCVELLMAGHQVTVVDNLSNSSRESLRRVEELADKKVHFFHLDIRDRQALSAVFSQGAFDAVIHFAGLKAVGESVQEPLKYYQNNVWCTLVLTELMLEHGVFSMIFSSSATVYGAPDRVPVTEDCPLAPTNPYGRTKWICEEILRDICVTEPRFSSVLLRYFNPVGAHPSGRIGENPLGIPNNLFPYISQVAVGRRPELSVFGDDYPTRDGTGVRDYLHVMDLAQGHVMALSHMEKGVHVFNLGTGRGYSVLEVVKAFESASGQNIPKKMVKRREGDIAEVYANPEKAFLHLGWKAKHGLDEMCRDSWSWQQQNPLGYPDD